MRNIGSGLFKLDHPSIEILSKASNEEDVIDPSTENDVPKMTIY